jgi:hypothetical protein
MIVGDARKRAAVGQRGWLIAWLWSTIIACDVTIEGHTSSLVNYVSGKGHSKEGGSIVTHPTTADILGPLDSS